MSTTMISCPECRSILKSGSPIPAGRRIKCPKCGSIFPAPATDSEESFGALNGDRPLAGQKAESKAEPEENYDESPSPRRESARQWLPNNDDHNEREEEYADYENRLPRRRRRRRNRQLLWLLIGMGGLVFLLLVGGGIAAVVWFGHRSRSQADAHALNDAIVNANQRLRAAGVSFGLAISPLRQGRNPDPKVVRTAHENTLKVLESVQTEMKTVKVPSSAAAQDLYQIYQRFLQNQEKVINNQMGEIVRVVENNKLSPADKNQKMTALLVEAQQIETNDLAALQAAQRRLADEYHVQLRYQ